MAGDVFPLLLGAYGCGPNSMVEHLFADLVEEWPHAVLESDGHGGKAGYVTRVQAFLHSVRAWRADGHGTLPASRLARFDRPLPHSLDAGYDRFFFGHLGGGLSKHLAAAMRGAGFDATYVGEPDAAALRAAGAACSGKECLPYQLIWGSFARFLEDEASRLDGRRALFLSAGNGFQACRANLFPFTEQVALERLGLGDSVEVADCSLVTANVRMMPLAWIALVAVDLLNMLRFYHLATERERGASDALFAEFSDRLEAMLEQPRPDAGLAGNVAEAFRFCSEVMALLAEAARRFREQPVHAARAAGLRDVYLCGDLYLRVDEWGNDDLQRKLADHGLRPIFEPYGAFFELLQLRQIQDGVRLRKLPEKEATLLTMRYVVRRLLRAVRAEHPWAFWHDLRDADRGDRLAERIPRDETPALAVDVAQVVPEGPRVLGAHGPEQPADHVPHREQRRLLLRQLAQPHAVLDLPQLQQLEERAVRLEDGAQTVIGELALEVVVAPLVDAQVEVAAQVHVAQAGGACGVDRLLAEAPGGLREQRLDLAAEAEGLGHVAGQARVGPRLLEHRLETVRELGEQRVRGTALAFGREVVEAQHVQQVDGHQRDPRQRHHAHVGGHPTAVSHLHAVAEPEPLQGDLFGEGEQIGAARLEPVAGAEEQGPAPVEPRRLVLEEPGEAAPDELIRQAFLARAGRARGAQRGRVGLADVGGVEAGAAHGGGQMLAEAAAQVAEKEPVVAHVQAVRQRAVEARQPGGRERPVTVRAPRPHAVQEGLHASHVAGLAAVPVALEDRVRPLLDEVGEEMLDHGVGAAPVGSEKQGEDIAGHGAGRRRAQRLAGARPVHPPEPGKFVGHRIAVHGQGKGAVRGRKLVDARVQHGIVDHVGLAGDEDHRVIVLARPGQGALADAPQSVLEAALAGQRGGVGGAEALGREAAGGAGGLRERLGRAPQRSPRPRRVEPIAFPLEQDGTQHAGPRTLGGQGARRHVRRALRHWAGVGHVAGVGQGQMHEERRHEHVHAGARETVQELDRGAGAGGGAAPVTLGQGAGPRTKHVDVIPQPAHERVEEGQSVDEVVDAVSYTH